MFISKFPAFLKKISTAKPQKAIIQSAPNINKLPAGISPEMAKTVESLKQELKAIENLKKEINDVVFKNNKG